MRLFYTEEFLGWNSEDWPVYLFYSILAVAFVACVLLSCRRYLPRLRPLLPNELVFLLCLVCTPLLIALFFAAGQVTMLPISEGVNQMPKFGCCSQAFVFPRSRIPDLVDLYTSKKVGYVDSLTEEFANENNEIRWAVTPSVMQHVGRMSTKASNSDTTDLFHINVKSKDELPAKVKLWNFAFETNDAAALHEEHAQINAQGGVFYM